MHAPLTMSSPRGLVSRAWSLSPALTLGTGVMLLGLVASTIGLVVDPRQLVGEPVWLKPTKFYASLAVYDVTLLYLFHVLESPARRLRPIGLILSLCGLQELAVITLQAARGMRSHFSVGTSLDRLLSASMGVTVVVLWVTMMVLAGVLMRARLRDGVLASALRLGVMVSVVGMGLAFFMTVPHGAQRTELAAGRALSEQGGHSFGGEDGGPGLPGVGWSTTVGDMRPAHFFGIHALQGLPLLAALLGRTRRSEWANRAIVRAAGVAWLGLTLVLGMQALRGQPVIHWDAVGLTGLGTVLLTSLATLVAHRAPRAQLVGAEGLGGAPRLE
ncbi:hypothetical protein [Melittangium boletus]|uniref:hypothetical protein n=1 Tax=Melittangium boletus TaxID=83453 RepID=UPI003DA6A859